jgi:hypothetical protein
VDEVKPAHIDDWLQKVVKRGAPIVANDVLRWVRRMFDYAVQRHMVEYNAAAAFSLADAGAGDSAVTDTAGTLYGVQAIGPDGSKRFNTGATLAGCCHLIGTPGRRLYLCEGWLARGKAHVLAGAPGTGKTSVALALAATLIPRLLACGADLSRIHFIGSVTEENGLRAFDPAQDAELLRAYAAGMSPALALLIVDPIPTLPRQDRRNPLPALSKPAILDFTRVATG